MAILVTGGAGYIGSHTSLLLLEAGWDVVVIDNFANSQPESLRRVGKLTGRECTLIEGDINNPQTLDKIFTDFSIDAVIHFAGLKAVGESNELPLSYYRNNVGGTLTLCEAMARHNCATLVFSSSATVYGDPATVPIIENSPTHATNPYGRSKLMVEEVLRDLQKSRPDFWKITLLRYFNPIGAHSSGEIGEDPNGIPNNLLPFVAQVATGRHAHVRVFGNDYNTPDGTGVRDYIHVVDLARGHLAAINHLRSTIPAIYTFNLGTGAGVSVLQIIEKFREVSGQPIPYEFYPRRPGDIATCYADATLAQKTLHWTCEYGLEEMISDTWRWQQKNPVGYTGT